MDKYDAQRRIMDKYENKLINIKIDEDSGEKTIAFGSNGYFMHEWVKTLPANEQLEWNTLSAEHEQVVERAIAVGDCVRHLTDPRDQQIHWVSEEIHKQWMDTIPENNHVKYLEFWTRYAQHSIDKQS